MPPHWRPGTCTRHGVRAWAVGQVMEFRQSLRQPRPPRPRRRMARVLRDELLQLPPRPQRQRMASATRLARPRRTAVLVPAALGHAPPPHRPRLPRLTRHSSTPSSATIARGVSRMNEPAAVAATADRRQAHHRRRYVRKIDALRWTDDDIRALMTHHRQRPRLHPHLRRPRRRTIRPGPAKPLQRANPPQPAPLTQQRWSAPSTPCSRR